MNNTRNYCSFSAANTAFSYIVCCFHCFVHPFQMYVRRNKQLQQFRIQNSLFCENTVKEQVLCTVFQNKNICDFGSINHLIWQFQKKNLQQKQFVFLWCDSPQWAMVFLLLRLHHHSWTHYTQQESPGRVISSSQRILPANITTLTGDRHPSFRGGNRPQSHEASGCRPTPQKPKTQLYNLSIFASTQPTYYV